MVRAISSLLAAPRRTLRSVRRQLKRQTETGETDGGGASIERFSSTVARSLTTAEAVDHLFDEIERRLGVEAALLALVEEEGGRAHGFAARGADERWWRGVEIDVEDDASGLAAAVRERTALAVYDLEAQPGGPLEPIGARSAAFVPLIADGRVSAVLVAVTLSARKYFPPSDLDLLAKLASASAPSLGRRRSAEALEASLARERLIASIGRKVRSELDLDSVLQVAVEETGRALGLSRCFIRLGEGTDDEPLPIRSQWTSEGLAALRLEGGQLAASNLAARERRTVAIGDVVTDPALDDPSLGGRDTLLDLGTRSALATPILVFDEMIGVFTLHRAQPGAWNDAEIALAEAIAGEVGLGIHAARLLRADSARLDRQSALLKAAQVVTSDLRFQSVLRRLVDEVARLLEADAADCWIYEPGQGLLRCRAVNGLPASEVGRRIRPAGTIGEAIADGRPVLNRRFRETEDPPPSRNYAAFEEVMVAPITWLGEVRGVLGICSRERGHFDETDLEVVDAYAAFASLAFHNAESFEERERKAQIQQGFYRIAEVLGSPLSLEETIEALAEAAAEALGGVSAFVLESRGERLVLSGSHDLRPALVEALDEGIPDGESPLAGAAREERLVTSGHVRDDDRFAARWRRLVLEDADAAALLAAPIPVPGGHPGVVIVLFTEERSFSDEDLALAKHLSRAARGALERGELFETERRARRLSQHLAEIGARLVTNLAPSVVLEDLVREAPALLEADAATIRLLEGDDLVVRAAAGVGGEAVHALVGTRAPIGTGLLGTVAQSREHAVVENAAEEPELRRGDTLLEGSMAACVAVPMSGQGGGLLGVLTVYTAAPRVWRDEESQALVALAALASAALSNAELYQRVAEEQERSSAILLNIADGIVAVDRDERIVLWNATAEQVTGVPALEALGRTIREVLRRDLAGAAQSGREQPVTIQRGGKDIFLSVTEAVMLDAGANVAGRIFAFRDVSSERVLDEMKSDFVATVSHELRTPLTSIYGFAETLLRSDVDFAEPERATFLGYIASESERLITIVDDLLNVARLEAGTLGLSLVPTDVGEAIAGVAERARSAIEDGSTLVVQVPDAPLLAQADPEKVAQVLQQLVENAVKFSPEGGTITVAARRRSDYVEVRVADEGIGIPRADRERIFTKFFRTEGAPTTASKGTGLGLFLVRGLLAAMGGRISVESVEGRGSTFTFELPVPKEAPAGRAGPVDEEAETEAAARS
ncbi:MAG TPA: GAF domain-containing protein [Gaiellaceae bacterium]